MSPSEPLSPADGLPPASGDPAGRGAGGAECPLEAEHRRLVSACLADAPGAWDEFVGRFAGLFGYVVGRTAAAHGVALGPGDRDDVVAEILLELLRSDARALRSFAARASLPTYLTVIARRVAVRAIERLRAGRAGDAAKPEPADRHDPVAALVDREAIESLLGTLDDTEARLVRLHYLEAKSYGEIGQLTGLPLGSIGPMLSRARQKLRDRAGGLAVP